jgi:pimeloyl-ACP methyl ester carboxylesterase
MIIEEDITFRNKDILLKGTLTKPDCDTPCPVVLVTHTSHAAARDFGVYQHLTKLLPPQGIAVFVYDRRGSGESSGDFDTASFFDLAEDAQAAVEHLKSRSDIDPDNIGVWGLSQGGWIAPLTAVNSPDIAFVIAVSSVGVSVAEQMNYSAEFELRTKGFPEKAVRQMLELRRLVDEYYRGKADRSVAQEELEMFRKEPWFPFAYLEDYLPEDPTFEKWPQIMDFDPLPIIREIKVPVLLLYAEEDPWVPIAKSIEIWKENGPNDLTIHQIKDANHFMISIAHAGIQADEGTQAEEYTTLLTQWLAQQLAV